MVNMIKIGIIGAGRIGRVHMEGVTTGVKNATVVAIADPFMNDDIKKWAAEYGVKTCYSDYHNILDDPNIDAVMICSSTDTHADIAIEAIRAHKHVFCEKPISQDLSKIKAVMEELKKSDVKFQVGFNRRFDHNFQAIRDAVEAGKIGDVHLIRVTARDPEAPSIDYVKSSGGMFLDMTIHDFDMVCFLSGCKVKEVYAAGAALVNPDIAKVGDIDTAVITLKMENGSIGVIDNSRQAVYGYDQRAEVFGSKGQINVANDTPSTAVLSTADGVIGDKPLYFFLERYMASFTKEVAEFTKAIENNTKVPVDVEEGLQPILIAIAAKKSLDENRPVKISEIEF